MDNQLEKEKVELEKKQLENKLLQLQIKNFDKTNKRLIAYITIVLTLVSSIIGFAVNYYNIVSKNAELEMKKEETRKVLIQKDIEVELKLMTFFLDNYDKFFSNDT